MMNEPTFTADTNQFTLVLCAANNVPAPNYEKDKFLIFHPVSDTSYIGLRGASYKGIVVTKDAAEQMKQLPSYDELITTLRCLTTSQDKIVYED